MNKLSFGELFLIVGGSSDSSEFSGMTCSALQNHAGLFGSNWSDEKWEEWIDAMIAADCPVGEATPA